MDEFLAALAAVVFVVFMTFNFLGIQPGGNVEVELAPYITNDYLFLLFVLGMAIFGRLGKIKDKLDE